MTIREHLFDENATVGAAQPTWLAAEAARHDSEFRLDTQGGFREALSPNGLIFAQVGSRGSIRLWDQTGSNGDGETPRRIVLRGFLLEAHSVAFSPDSKRLAAGSNSREAIKLWDVMTGQELLTLEGIGTRFGQFGGTAFSPDGNILGSMNDDGEVHLWQAPSWTEIEASERDSANSRQPRIQ